MNSPLRLKYPISVRYSSPRSRSRRAEYGVYIPVLSEMLTTRTLRPSKSTFPPCWAAPITSSCVIPVGLPSSVIRASLPTASELDSELRPETVRKLPEAPETRAHKAPKPACPARFGPDRGARYTPGASLAPLFGQFQNSVNAKFRESTFHALGCIRVRRRVGAAKPRPAL